MNDHSQSHTRIVGLLVVALVFLFGSETTQAQQIPDSTQFSYSSYLQSILQNHPVAQQAGLLSEKAEAEMQAARGGFDPTISSGWNEKNFHDNLYYRQYQAELRVPTPLGIDVVSGYENSEGYYLNPQNQTDEYGLWHLGMELNLLQGLWTNERKIALKQARIFKDRTESEQRILLNELLYSATGAYLLWQQYENFKVVLTENVTLAHSYLENTKAAFENGEKTAIDTLEAYISYQDARTQKQKNELGLIKARQNVENFLWSDQQALSLPENSSPQDYKLALFPNYSPLADSTLNTHPELLAASNKLASVELDLKMKREKLKPKLKLKYNSLLETSDEGISPSFSINNYKWGFDFSMPIFLRQERGQVKQGKIKVMETQLDIQNKRNSLRNKLESSWMQQQLLEEQRVLLEQNVNSYRKLLEGEQEKFNYGESSVFLLNKRQEKYINGQLKLIETHIKQQVELLNYLFYSNQLLSGR